MKISSVQDLDIGDFGALRSTYYSSEFDRADSITEVGFVFDETTLRITINNEDDTLSLYTNESNIGMVDNIIRNKQFDELISSLISKSLLWVWELTNQQGYNDGLQFEFRDEGHESNVIIQFVAVASTIKVCAVQRIT